MASIDRSYTTLYWSAVVTIALSCTFSSYLPPTKQEVHDFARVCLSICLSVCLSVSKITQKRVHRFG